MPDDNLLEMFRKGLNADRKQRKSDDILGFMRSNWKLFCASRQQMMSIIEELEQHQDLSVTALAAALDLPKEIVFKKTKVVDTAKLMLHPKTSALFKLFMEQREKRSSELCVVAVAGDHSLVMTDMPTETVEGLFHMFIPLEDGTRVNIFPASDAQLRMPRLFIHEE